MDERSPTSGDDPLWDTRITAQQRVRLQTIWHDTCAALQGVVEKHGITQTELKNAGLFFNRLGQSGMFPSLLAVGLAVKSVQVTEAREGATTPNIEGPFHIPGAPFRPDGVCWEQTPGPEAVFLDLYGQVLDAATKAPIEGAVIDLWQADENGTYDNSARSFHLRGRIRSEVDGQYLIRTIRPKDYAEHDQDPIGELFRAMGRHNRRAAHIHVKVGAEGYRPLTTQLFAPDGDHLQDDYVEGTVLPELVLGYEERGSGRLASRFDFRLARSEASK